MFILFLLRDELSLNGNSSWNSSSLSCFLLKINCSVGRKVFTSQTPLVSLKEFLASILLLLHLLLLLNDDAAESSDPVITVERGGFQKVKPIWLNKVYMKDRISFFLLMSHVSELIRANFCCPDFIRVSFWFLFNSGSLFYFSHFLKTIYSFIMGNATSHPIHGNAFEIAFQNCIEWASVHLHEM